VAISSALALEVQVFFAVRCSAQSIYALAHRSTGQALHRLSVAITAGRTLHFKRTPEPDPAAAAAPMPVHLIFGKSELDRERRQSEIPEAAGSTGRHGARVWKRSRLVAPLWHRSILGESHPNPAYSV
jgi:hypothetical protein